jgi:hygromycin-B 4-O-kinase
MRITLDRLRLFLSAHLQTDITAIEPVNQGEWSQTFFFTANQQQKVIRFSAFDEDFKKDRFAARYSSAHLPIPQIEEIGEAFDLYFAISPRVEGKMIDEFNAAEMREALPALMDVLNALHEVDGSQTHGYGGFGTDGNGIIPSWREYLSIIPHDSPDSRLRGWKENLARNKTTQEVYQLGRQRLLDLVPFCPEERHLVHNDLLHFNLIMQENKVVAVIDWGCALWGDFLYDLAMFAAWQFYYPAMADINFAEEAWRSFSARHVPLVHFHERLQCYQVHLLLDSLVYNSWKEDRTNLDLTIRRLKEILIR